MFNGWIRVYRISLDSNVESVELMFVLFYGNAIWMNIINVHTFCCACVHDLAAKQTNLHVFSMLGAWSVYQAGGRYAILYWDVLC